MFQVKNTVFKLIQAFKEAEIDLNIKIQSPFILKIDSEKTVQIDLLVENFGSKMGTIVFSIDEKNILRKMNEIKKLGYYCSALNIKNYSKYNRPVFIDCLNDWGYFGDLSNIPNWYSGKHWS